MIIIATVTAAFITSSGRSMWFVGVLLVMVYVVFDMRLYMSTPTAE